MSSKRPDLVPTSIVDSRGRQTTVHRKPLDASSGASKALPAPAGAPASEKRRDALVADIIDLVPRAEQHATGVRLRYVDNEDALRDVKRILEAPHVGASSSIASLITEFARNETGRAVISLFADKSDMLTQDFGLSDMFQLYLGLLTRYAKDSHATHVPSDEQFTAHLYVATRYNATTGSNNSYGIPNGPRYYHDNEELMDFVTRHPDKADVIISHRAAYLPETNGFESFEADLEKLSKLSKPVSDGWL